jgi:hypothetical protein
MWDFVMDKSGGGAGFLRVLGFPLPIFIPKISPQSQSPIIRGRYNRPVVAAVPKVLVRKPEGKRPLGRPRRRWVDNIKMDLGEIGMGWSGLDRTGSG